MPKEWIYVNAYPKSGLTWLIHLLCDVLDATQMNKPGDERKVWGDTGTSPYIVSKQHVPAWDWPPKDMPQGKLVVTTRDPRDVAVSAYFYRKTKGSMIKDMATLWNQGWTLDDYLSPYLGQNGIADVVTRYEWLKQDTVGELRRIVKALTAREAPDEILRTAVKRQSLTNMRAEHGSHFVRKGIVGDWQNHFTREIGQEFDRHLGEFMLKYGYIDDRSWWQHLPETR